MSSATYEQLLREALVDLSDMQEVDAKSVGRKYGSKKAEDHQYFLHHWAALYLRYVQVARKLAHVHDQILQPQKRLDSRILLDSTLGRLLEMKTRIVEMCGEYVNLDEVLVDLKLTPDVFEIPIPTYFAEEREESLAMWNEVISTSTRNTSEDANVLAARPGGAPAPELPMSIERAVEVIQCNERGRQGRQKAKFMKSVQEQTQMQSRNFEYEQNMDRDKAALNLQRVVKGFLVRKKYDVMKREQLEFLGMEYSEAISSNAQAVKLQQTLRARKDKQRGNEAELGQKAKEMRAKIKVQEGGRIMEEMLDEVLMHLSNLRLNGDEDMPEFPSEEEGGSLALLGLMPGQLSPEQEAKKKAEEEAAAAAAKKGGKKDGPAKKKTDKELEEEAMPTIEPSKFWNRFDAVRKRYTSTWQRHFQQTYLANKDFEQAFDKDLLRVDIMEGAGGVLSELRRCVDQLVTVEVANLKERIEREKGGKRKKPKAKKPPKKKAMKDPTEGKPIDYHTKWLADFGAIEVPAPVRLKEYLGAPNMLGSVVDEYERTQAQQQDELKKKWQTLIDNWNDYVEQSLRMSKEQFVLHFESYCQQGAWSFEPSMQQVRQAVTEYCVLPLGSQVIHDLAPNNTAVLLYGPKQSGKSMLTHAICREAGAHLFTISPAVINQEGVPLPKLLQTTFRIARSLAPSVIYLDEVEKVFASTKGKKKKKKDGAGAGRSGKIKKDLLKQMLELDPTDRVLVVGNSSCPWEAEQKDIRSFFQRFIYCVHPDYSSRLLLWQSKCQQRGASLKDEDYEVLAYMTNKYSSGTICRIIEETLTDRRVKRTRSRPVAPEEFLPAMSRARPIYKEEYEATKEFTKALDFRARRAIFPDDFKQDDADDEKGKKGKKAPSKKKAA